MQLRQAWVLRAFGIWTIYVWATRMWNILRDDERDGAFKAVHSVLALISVVFAIACLMIVRNIRSRRGVSDAPAEPNSVTVDH